jgi:hypothetical protein
LKSVKAVIVIGSMRPSSALRRVFRWSPAASLCAAWVHVVGANHETHLARDVIKANSSKSFQVSDSSV